MNHEVADTFETHYNSIINDAIINYHWLIYFIISSKGIVEFPN